MDYWKINELKELRGDIDNLTITIITNLKQRSKYFCNKKSFIKGYFDIDHSLLNWDNNNNNDLSRVELALLTLEDAYCRVGRYNFIDQYPILRNEPIKPAIELALPETSLKIEPIRIDIKNKIFDFYPKFIEKIAKEGEDEYNYGSIADIDAKTLIATNQRIHIGRFVAYVKERDNKKIGSM